MTNFLNHYTLKEQAIITKNPNTMKKTQNKSKKAELPKILVVKSETANAAWNKSLPVSLKLKEKVIVMANQTDVPDGYVRIRHGADKKKISVFSLANFTNLSGKEMKK